MTGAGQLRRLGAHAVIVVLCALGLAVPAWGWNSHAVASYRALERMPEVANAAPVAVETLEAFLRAEEHPIEALLASQEAWAGSNLANYPRRAAGLAFTADPARSDEARRLAFLRALRVAPDARLALYLQPDPQAQADARYPSLPWSAVVSLPEPANNVTRFVALQPGQTVSALAVLASATQEPDFGLDINLFDDSPTDWGKQYGWGKLPFGNPAVNFSTQAPFHMGFYHQDRVLYLAAPFLKRTYPALRSYQFATLAALAFRTGHAYWGWRFTGLSLHYVQDLTQPYHASLAPGHGSLELIGINTLAMVGLPRRKNEMVTLLSNRHLALEKYQAELVLAASTARQDTPVVLALRDSASDARYPAWTTTYARDVVALEAAQHADQTVQVLLGAMPAAYVSDPGFDLGASDAKISLTAEVAKQDPARRAALDADIALLLGHYGAHSRNAVRAVLSAGGMIRR